jgi:hypothetical protein
MMMGAPYDERLKNLSSWQDVHFPPGVHSSCWISTINSLQETSLLCHGTKQKFRYCSWTVGSKYST